MFSLLQFTTDVLSGKSLEIIQAASAASGRIAMSDRMKQVCMCGCGGRAYHNQMVVVEAEEAIDFDLRKTGTTRRFWVLSKCREDFEQELALTVMLQKLVRVWYDKPFWKRIFVARNVMRMQHKIFERNRGFEYARAHATNSAILFGAPRIMQGWLARRLSKRLAAAERKRLEETDGTSSQDGSDARSAEETAQKA